VSVSWEEIMLAATPKAMGKAGPAGVFTGSDYDQ